ncbi:unnamed protein product, partial [Effrenium voratum]
ERSNKCQKSTVKGTIKRAPFKHYKAAQEIKAEQASGDFAIPKGPFGKLAKEVLAEILHKRSLFLPCAGSKPNEEASSLRITADALDILQTATEARRSVLAGAMLVDLMAAAARSASERKKATVS